MTELTESTHLTHPDPISIEFNRLIYRRSTNKHACGSERHGKRDMGGIVECLSLSGCMELLSHPNATPSTMQMLLVEHCVAAAVVLAIDISYV